MSPLLYANTVNPFCDPYVSPFRVLVMSMLLVVWTVSGSVSELAKADPVRACL